MKKTSIAILFTLCLLLLTACGSQKAYRDDLSVAQLTEQLLPCIAAREDLSQMRESYVSGIMEMDTQGFEEYAVYVSAVGTNIDEIGVFKLKSISGPDAEKLIKAYLQMREETWMKEYIPEEHPKLSNAEIRVCGNYVLYAILNDTERNAVISAFETALAK